VVSLLIEPPVPSEQLPIAPREVVFLLDTSCSMAGEPMDASKRFMTQALQGLRPQDTFRVLRFSDSASGLSEAPLPATPLNVARGQTYVDELVGQGGTMMTQGVRAALEPAADPERVRIVVFLTDGYIGNDVEVIGLVEQELGDARLFSLGVGGNVNRYLLEEMARSGRGTARIVEDPAQAQAAAESLAAQLESPFLTDVEIDWGDAVVEQVTPRVLPDLFLGDSLRVMALVQAPGTLDVTVRGTLGGERVALLAQVVVPAESEGGEALPVVWARGVISDLMLDYISPRTDAVGRERVQHQVTALGLEHRLVTRWTSFVAVAPAQDMVRGPMESDRSIASSGYRSAGSGRSWGGSAAPEPHIWAALALLSLMGGLGLRRRTG
jgi:Ca-activated chloride channel family protein